MKLGCVFVVVLLCVCADANDDRSVPHVEVHAFKPQGFRATIPDSKDIAYFVVQGLLKRNGQANQIDVAGETGNKVHIRNGYYWVVDIPDLKLEVGDVIDYLAFVAFDSAGYIKDNLKFEVETLENYVPLPYTSTYPPIEAETTASAPVTTAVPPCGPTATRLRQGTACAGQIIFEDNFDTLRTDIWQVQHYIPVDHPELPFVSYQRSAVSVKDGNLHITPSLQLNQSASLYSSLDLNEGCTSGDATECAIVAGDVNPVPPVSSGRLISKPGFAFTYGTVSVRAKFPKGDWIYPEILLEPLLKKFTFGSTNTGILKIASASGNENTTDGNKVLYGGPVLDTKCHDALLLSKTAENFWSNDFHVYSLQWTPERLILSVDGAEYARVEPAENGLRARLPATCPGRQAAGMAPFDEHFYLTLGLAVGGHSEFSDSIETNPAKPWKNFDAKASINFWNNVETWYPTWQQPELIVDYVKVVAL